MRKTKRWDAPSRKLLARINTVAVSVDDLTQVTEEVAKLAPQDRGFVGHSMTAVRVLRADAEKVHAVLLRLEALARIIGGDGVPGWTLPKQSNGLTLTQEPMFAAAALQPLIVQDGEVAFDRGAFLQKVLELAEVDGEG